MEIDADGISFDTFLSLWLLIPLLAALRAGVVRAQANG